MSSDVLDLGAYRAKRAARARARARQPEILPIVVCLAIGVVGLELALELVRERPLVSLVLGAWLR